MATSSSDKDIIAAGVDTLYMLWGASMVFFMQAGFTALEVGHVSVKNTKSVLTKNVGDAMIGSLMWWLLGYGFAFGNDSGGFIGKTLFAFSGSDFPDGYSFSVWLFEWAFAATAATIVSGAVAERVNFTAYLVYTSVVTGFIYPVVVHWAWSDGGWASPFNPIESELLFDCGAIDFAGSGVVHMVGGTAALMAAWVVGPRVGRFNEDGTANALPQQSAVLQTLGVLFLWFAWYGFNGGSALVITTVSGQQAAARACVATTIAAAAGGFVSVLWAKLVTKHFWDNAALNNGILAGLVAVTAGCATYQPEVAFVVGIVAGMVYNLSSDFLIKIQVDDVVDAVPVHLFCGMWGVLAPGFLAGPIGYGYAYGHTYDSDGSSRQDRCAGVCYGGSGRQLAAQVVYILAIFGWVGSTSLLLFLVLNRAVGMRVSREIEEIGMDSSKHGGQTYPEMRALRAQQEAAAAKMAAAAAAMPPPLPQSEDEYKQAFGSHRA